MKCGQIIGHYSSNNVVDILKAVVSSHVEEGKKSGDYVVVLPVRYNSEYKSLAQYSENVSAVICLDKGQETIRCIKSGDPVIGDKLGQRNKSQSLAPKGEFCNVSTGIVTPPVKGLEESGNESYPSLDFETNKVTIVDLDSGLHLKDLNNSPLITIELIPTYFSYKLPVHYNFFITPASTCLNSSPYNPSYVSSSNFLLCNDVSNLSNAYY